MNKELTIHKGNSLNDRLKVFSVGHPGAGGAPTHYAIYLVREDGPGEVDGTSVSFSTSLRFQVGDPKVEVNGISNESILAILIDRLRGFQSGPYPCEENSVALQHLQEAMNALQARAHRIENPQPTTDYAI